MTSDIHIVAYLLKGRIVKPTETAVARERLCRQTFVRRWFSRRHVIDVTDTYTTIEELLEAVFCAVRAESI
jgi:hypothetical protein